MIDEPVSIIIPTFSRAHFLGETIHSVLSEMASYDELLVVNDGSEDNTIELLRSFGDRLRFISIKNSGKSAALNLALQETSKPYIWIVDDDDLVCKGARNILMEVLHQHQADLAYGRFHRFRVSSSGDRDVFDTGHWVKSEPEKVLVNTLQDMFIHQPGMIAKRSLYERAGPFDETLPRSVDYEMITRLLWSGKAVGTEDIVFLQRQHDGVRGPKNFNVTDRVSAWKKWDRVIFENIRSSMPLAAFHPRKEICTEGDRRLATLQRAVVFARHKLWDDAIDDFEIAVGIDGADWFRQASPIIRQTTFSKYGCDELVSNAKISETLIARLQSSSSGRFILASLARSLIYQIKERLKERNFVSAVKYAKAVLCLAIAGSGALKDVLAIDLARQAGSEARSS